MLIAGTQPSSQKYDSHQRVEFGNRIYFVCNIINRV